MSRLRDFRSCTIATYTPVYQSAIPESTPSQDQSRRPVRHRDLSTDPGTLYAFLNPPRGKREGELQYASTDDIRSAFGPDSRTALDRQRARAGQHFRHGDR